MDRLTPEARSRLMARICSRDTKPEVKARKLLHAHGFRFRLHRKDLPGTPDIVLTKWRSAIFVHGCFWHRHAGCRHCTNPQSNRSYWLKKFRRNIARDRRNARELMEFGWKVIVVWECELEEAGTLISRLASQIRSMSNPSAYSS